MIKTVKFTTSMLHQQPGASPVTGATAKAKAADVSADSEAARSRRTDMLLDQIETCVTARAQFAEYSGQARQRASDLIQQIDALKTGDVRFKLHCGARGLAI